MNAWTEHSMLDPYQILGIPYTASEEQIRQAFQKKMAEADEVEKIVTAYGKIRDAEGRRRFRWGSIWSQLRDPQQDMPPAGLPDVPALIAELAFRTAWELGDETCLK